MEQLFEGFLALSGRQAIMMGVGAALLYLAIAKEYEPSLLLPMGFGTLLVNIPFTSALTHMAGEHIQHGALSILF
ncbi:MAG: glutaconyl-CoA decarboxylase subunit beta, partial [Synergistales bacterium]|nr:glutaconyl-CoA decarboxylase subunit beta [Synergistales bacterium]